MPMPPCEIRQEKGQLLPTWNGAGTKEPHTRDGPLPSSPLWEGRMSGLAQKKLLVFLLLPLQADYIPKWVIHLPP